MARAVRALLLAVVLAPVVLAVGCDPKADSTPNPNLGGPPTLPNVRGGEGQGGGPVDPNAPKTPKK